MGLSCQKTQVTGWGPLSCREQTALGTWQEAGCRCIVWTLGVGMRAFTPGVSGPVSQPTHPGLCIRLYTEKGILHQALEAGTSSFSHATCAHRSPHCLQEVGQGTPSPQLPFPRYMAHIQVHHHIEHTALPARVKTWYGGLQVK